MIKFFGIKRAKKALVISSFPPRPCGIGSYAEEHVIYLKKSGLNVYTQSFFKNSAANFNYPNNKIYGVACLLISAIAGRFDRVYLHFSNGIIWVNSERGILHKLVLRVFQYLWLLILAKVYGSRITIILHEVNTDEKRNTLLQTLEAFVYRSFSRIEIHTQNEKLQLINYCKGSLNSEAVKIVNHSRFMRKNFKGSRQLARQQLGLNLEAVILLCIGFLQRNKSFETAIRAMKELSNKECKLYIVGSSRNKDTDSVEYIKQLKKEAAEVDSVTLIEVFLDDFSLDKWIVAADTVIVPYKEIWSSGIAARASLLGTSIIARDHPSLVDQLYNRDGSVEFFTTEKQLSEVIRHIIPSPTSSLSLSTDRQLNTPSSDLKKILFIIPCFGKNVKGGAEKFVYKLAEFLDKDGFEITVWATDSDAVVGRNHALAEVENTEKITVRRFESNPEDERVFSLCHRFVDKGSWLGRFLGRPWIQYNIFGKGMEEALISEAQKFDVIHLFHYLVGTSHRLSGIFPEKTIIHPFIHNEAAASHSIMRELFSGVCAVTVATQAEVTIGQGTGAGLLQKNSFAIGVGLDVETYKDFLISNPAIRSRESRGYLIYVGHISKYKNVHQLIEWHRRLLETDKNAPKLILVGKNYLSDSDKIMSEDIEFFEFQPKDKLLSFIRNARALVNISLLESFSIVVMEALLLKVPVIVHEDCLATKQHLLKNSNGFAVKNFKQYSQAINRLKDSDLREKMGNNGQKYVEENYRWQKIIENYRNMLNSMF